MDRLNTRLLADGPETAAGSPSLPRRHATLRLLLATAALLLSTACATYGERLEPLEGLLQQGEIESALALFEETSASDADRVVNLLNRGALLRMAGDPRGSNAALEAARTAMDALDPTSISENVGSLMVGETVFAYVGAPHERVLLHLLKAFNYLDLGEFDAARVEALRVDLRLQEMARGQAASTYRSDPFARFLSGMLFERLGEPDQALVAYREAYHAYREQLPRLGVAVPRSLQLDLLRLAKVLGVNDDLERWRAEFGVDRGVDPQEHAEAAHLVWIVGSGLAPRKGEQGLTVQDSQGRVHRIALPRYEPRRAVLAGFRVSTDGATASSEVVHDIDAVARLLLDEQQGALVARALARLLVQKEMIDQARDVDPFVGVAMNLFTLVADRADTRTWLTLPARYHMVRLSVPPGVYDLDVEFTAPGGSVVGRRVAHDILLEAGRFHFFFDRWISPRVGTLAVEEGS